MRGDPFDGATAGVCGQPYLRHSGGESRPLGRSEPYSVDRRLAGLPLGEHHGRLGDDSLHRKQGQRTPRSSRTDSRPPRGLAQRPARAVTVTEPPAPGSRFVTGQVRPESHRAHELVRRPRSWSGGRHPRNPVHPPVPDDPRHALPAAARYVAAGPLPRDYRCPYRYDRARRSVSTAWLSTRDLGDDGSASRCLRDGASRGEFDHAQRMGCSPGRIMVHRILAVTSRRFQGFPTEALGVACVLPH